MRANCADFFRVEDTASRLIPAGGARRTIKFTRRFARYETGSRLAAARAAR
jgi:hypothetical protein